MLKQSTTALGGHIDFVEMSTGSSEISVGGQALSPAPPCISRGSCWSPASFSTAPAMPRRRVGRRTVAFDLRQIEEQEIDGDAVAYREARRGQLHPNRGALLRALQKQSHKIEEMKQEVEEMRFDTGPFGM